MYKVNKQNCTGCQVCVQTCPGATRIGADGKAEVVDQKKLEACGGEKVCPFGAIEKIEGEYDELGDSDQPSVKTDISSNGVFLGRRRVRGGKGIGLRGGRGKGRGRGGRRQV